MRISESHYSSLERLPERAKTDSFNTYCHHAIANVVLESY